MKGDFTRDTFDPAKHFSRVLMQQGRVQLDADWNEQTAILLHYLRTLAKDILGPHRGPAVAGEADEMGFELVTEGSPNAEARITAMEPDEARRQVLLDGVRNRDKVIGIGRYYVHGILVENHRAVLYTEQVGYPFSPDTELSDLRDKELLAYLDVWERHITYVQDDHIREVALGGADTCTRAQVVWQVKALLRDGQDNFGCAFLDDLLARANVPMLRARAQRGTTSTELCTLAPESRYRGLENQLYRVEVHEVATTNDVNGQVVQSATFKWSRDNGSVVFPLVSLTGTTVVVTSLGRDHCSQLKSGDWVEVCDNVLALREQSGPLALVEAVDREELKVTLKWPAGVTTLPSYTEADTSSKHPLLRRWDHAGKLAAHHGALPVVEAEPSEEGWIELEDGVQVWFVKGGAYRAGDYWLIPARVATGDVEWPLTLDSNGKPVAGDPAAMPPHGPEHHYAPLIYVIPRSDGEEEKTEDCRCRIPTLPCQP
jgi:hypothetical protein